MIFTLFITCLLGLGALQPSCSAPRSDEIQVVESKYKRNEISYGGFDNYSICNFGFTENDFYNIFTNYDTGYLPWQFSSQLRSLKTGLDSYAWGQLNDNIYSNTYNISYSGKVGILYNYDLNYNSTQPISVSRENICVSYLTSISLNVYKCSSYNNVDPYYATIQVSSPFYYIDVFYFIGSSSIYYQRFLAVIPNSYQPNYKIYEVKRSNGGFFIDLGFLNSNRNVSYTGAFPLSPLLTNTYCSPSNFSLLCMNSNLNSSLISNGFDGASSSLDNFIFSMKSNIPYYYGLNVGLDQYSDGALTNAYNTGYNRGYVNGRSTKDLEVYDEAFEEGYDQGVIRGQEIASDPASEIYETIYNAGKQEGITEGYNSASADSGVPAMIFSGILSVALIPVNVFIQMFQYEIFGINVAGLISGLITIAMVIIIVRFLLGGKTDDK